MEQLTLDDAREGRDKGIADALDHADHEVKHWRDLAYTYLVSYCRRHGEIFTGEDAVDASKRDRMIEPPNDKAWGGVIKRAALAGVIVKVDTNGVRRKGHTSPCPRWRSLIYGKPA